MRELRFHRSLYAGEAIDDAMKRLDGFAAFERAIEDEHFVVRITAPDDERRIAGELANFALGLTVERGGATGPAGERGGAT